MKSRAAISFILLLSCVLSQARVVRTVNDGWTFTKEGESEVVDLPHTWNADDTRDDVKGYWRGRCTYSRSIDIPALNGGHAYLRVGAANQTCKVRVNGLTAGEHKGGYTAFCFDITALVKAGANLVELEVDNSHDADLAPVSADFTFYGGVYRDVELILTGRDDICCTHYGSGGVFVSTPSVSAGHSSVEVRTLLGHGSGWLVQKIYSPDGHLVASKKTRSGGERELVQTLEIYDCCLWDVDSPALYRLETSLTSFCGRVKDSVTSVFGLRSFRFSSDEGFFLNGKPLKLMGAARHQDFEFIGNALPKARHIDDIRLLKDMGANFLRTAHYPQDRAVMNACDSLGILASVEIPVVDYATPSPAFLENQKEQLRDMIWQNFNSPSVILWGYMNEALLSITYRMKATQREKDEYNVNLLEIAKALDGCAKSIDPGRPTLICCADDIPGYTRSGIVNVPDVLGWNFYRGWYGRSIEDFGPALDELHSMFPDKPLLVSEYGAGVDPRLHSDRPEKFDFSAEYGLSFHRSYASDILSRPFIAGGSVWALADFYSEARVDAVPHVNNKGLTSLSRGKKNVYYFYKALLSSVPILEIGDRDWPQRSGNAGAARPVPIFTNMPSVCLSVNGSSLGEHTAEGGVAFFDVMLSDGFNLLEARAGELTDTMTVRYRAFDISRPDRLDVMLGGSRYLMADGICWIPEQPYEMGGWGYVGGFALRPKVNGREAPCSNASILGTDIDPVYQSQRMDIEAFRADLPAGRYRVVLHFAELATGGKTSALKYNLGQDFEPMAQTERVFNISANGVSVLSAFNISEEVGTLTAVQKSFDVDVSDGGLDISFERISGSPVLNGIQIINLLNQ